MRHGRGLPRHALTRWFSTGRAADCVNTRFPAVQHIPPSMTEIIVPCPNCRASLLVDEQNAGRDVLCPECQIRLTLPAELKEGLKGHTLLDLATDDPLETMRSLEGAPGMTDVAVFGSGLHITVDDPKQAEAAIRERLTAKGIELRRIGEIAPSMEDVFVAMIEAEERKGTPA